ncbi:MAG: hypothetical protein ACM359_04340 [Bacillota bacterium]
MTGSRMAGMLFQAVVLGALLFLAVMKLIALGSNARVFQYQGF